MSSRAHVEKEAAEESVLSVLRSLTLRNVRMHAVDARNLVVVRKHAKATPAAIPNGLGIECGWHPWMVSTFAAASKKT